MAALMFAAAPAAGGAEVDDARQLVKLEFTTSEPSAPSGNRFDARWRNPRDPDGKPYAMKRLVTRLPVGFTYDTSAIDQCHASDQELVARGSDACPPGSFLSRGTMVSDGGEASPLPRHMTFSLTMFNSDDEFLSVIELIDPAFDPPFRMVSHNTIRGNVVTTEFPTFPGGGPPDGYMAIQSMQVAGEPKVRDGRAYGRMPATCPADGYWTTNMEFVYQDGITQAVETRSPCRRAGASPRPSIRIGGIPRRRCASRPFTARVRVSTRKAGLARAVLLLDRRVIHRTTRRKFAKRIDPARLTRGNHRLTVRVRDSNGRHVRRTVVFRSCRA